MGGLLAFRVGNYDNTAEREQFRFLCEQLKAHYENSNEFCVFVGNYNIGCELDALFIKKDAIIAIEFKNYGGNVIAKENGEWTCDGTTIKGGSRKTVLQQARINHSIVKKELKVLGVEAKQIKDVPTLVVFHQPIVLTNNLSATNKSWLHITDDDHFIEKLDDITCPHTDLNPLGIVNLAELLNLNSFYLTEFSNANYDKPVQPSEHIDLFEDIKKYETPKVTENPNSENSENNSSNPNIVIVQNSANTESSSPLTLSTTEALIPLRDYASQIVSAVWNRSNYEIYALTHNEFKVYFNDFASVVKLENIIVLLGAFTEDEKNHLQKFLNKNVYVLSEESLFWQTGDFIDSFCNEPVIEKNDSASITKLGSNTKLPSWLDNCIFNELGAKFLPDHVRFEYNLDLKKEEVLAYLGTYFPRSYMEVYHLFSDLLLGSNYQDAIHSKDELNILDLGCGTGGDIIGLLSFINDNLSFVNSVNILAIDGNHESLRIFEKVLACCKKHSRLNVKETIGPAFIESEDDLDLISQVVSEDFDFILSCKAICEMLAKNRIKEKAYKRTASLLSKKLAPIGILLIEDVTVKSNVLNEFIPVILSKELNEFINENQDFASLSPIPCREHGALCEKGCFFKKELRLSHSQKSNDISKITYRFISHKLFADSLKLSNNNTNNIHCNI